MRIDSHQHFWDLDRVEYPWLGPSHGVVNRTFQPVDLEPELRAAGIDQTVLVQSANSHADTEYMLEQATVHEWIGAVIGWVPLLDPPEAERALDRYRQHAKFRGIRHLNHDEPDPDWVVRPAVIDGITEVAERGLVYELVAIFPNHLRHVPTLIEKVPGLTLVIDHLAKPPIKQRQLEPWATELAAAARYPNVYSKVSGLDTAADWETWTAADLKPFVDFAIETFGADRLMFGSNWPMCLKAGGYAKVWRETLRVLETRSAAERDAILGGTVARVYRL